MEHKKNDLTFQHNENDIGINYTGLSYHSGGNIQYRYKLHRNDPWRYTRNTSVYLPALPDDQYEFIVACKGRTGIWSKAASISFLVKKPFWRTYAFIAAVIVLSGGLIWIGFVLYFRSQRKKIVMQNRMALSELRSLRSQMNPHFLFNALNSIQGVLMKNKPQAAQDYLGKFGKLMRTILDHSDKTSVSIAEELESITYYLEIEQLRCDNRFRYNIYVDPELDQYNAEIPAMIIQPFIENAIWHGFGQQHENGVLDIKFLLDKNNAILIIIQDNGIGRRKAAELQKNKEHKSKGIQLVKERIDILNVENSNKIELDIEDLEDEQGHYPGTRVTIKIPSL